MQSSTPRRATLIGVGASPDADGDPAQDLGPDGVERGREADPRDISTRVIDLPVDTDDVVDGRYRLIRRIGSGGMSVVWEAHDLTLDRLVAVKLLHASLAQDEEASVRFAREARRTASLRSPHLAQVMDAGSDGDLAYLVMELISGIPLTEDLGTPLRPQRVLRLGRDVAEALALAHAEGIVHRDVKPSNIIMSSDGAVLVDFGIAWSAADTDLTRAGQMIGTPAYISPEQAQGHPITAASDVYSLGCVLFETTMGRRRFPGTSDLAVAMARVGTPTTRNDVGPGVPGPLTDVLCAFLQPDPADRPADGAEAGRLLAEALSRVSGSHPIVAGSPGPGTREPQRTSQQAEPETSGRDGAVPGASPAAVPLAVEDQRRPSSDPWVPPRRRDRNRTAALTAVAALVLLAVAVVAGQTLSGGPEVPSPGDAVAGDGADASTAAPVPGQDMTATSFDPEGGGDEHEDEVALLLDGDPATVWTTERYDTAAFGNLKSGVGVVIDLGQATALQGVRLQGMPSGQSVQLLAAEGPPAALGDATLVSSVDGAGAEVDLVAPDTITSRYLVVWLRGPLPGPEFRGRIGEIQLLADAVQ